MTSDSEYGTPEVLSVDDIVPPDHRIDESVVEPSLQLIEQFADNIRSLSVELVETNNENVSLSKCISRTSFDHVEDGCAISDQVASDTSIQDHNELGSSDMFPVVAQSKQATPPKNSKDLSCESSNRENYGIMKDEHIVQTPAQLSPENESKVSENLETLSETCTATTREVDCRNEPSAEGQFVGTFGDTCPTKTIEVDGDKVDQHLDCRLNSSSNSLMALAQATLTPFVGEITTNYAKQEGEAPSTSSDSLVIVHLKAHDGSVMTNVPNSQNVTPPDFINVLPTIQEDQLVVDEVHSVPESGSFFKLPSLKETLYAALGFQTADTTNSSGTIIPAESDTLEENDQSHMMNSSAVVHATTTLNETLRDESYCGDQSVENISSQSSVLVESVEGATMDFAGVVDGLTMNEEQTEIQSSITELGKPIGPLDTLILEDTPVVSSMVERNISSVKISETDKQQHNNVTIDATGSLKVSTLDTEGDLLTSEVLSVVNYSLPLLVGMRIENDSKSPNSYGRDVLLTKKEDDEELVGNLLIVEDQLGHAADMEAHVQTTVPLNMNLSDPQVNPDVSGNTSNQGEPKITHKAITGMTLEQLLKASAAASAASTVSEIIADHVAELIQELHSDYEITSPPHILGISEDSNTELNVIGSNIEAQKQATAPLNFYLSDSQVNPDGSGNTSNQVESQEIFICYDITPAQLTYELSTATPAASTVELLDEIIGDHVDELERPSARNIEKIAPGFIADDDEKPLILERSKDSKNELNVTGSTIVAPLVSTDTTIHSRAGPVEISTVSEGKEIASVKTVSKTSSAITDRSKRIPVKTLAQIKASAKARISTGLTASSKAKKKPLSKLSSPTSPTNPSSEPTTSPRSSSYKDRLIPGTVNGRLD